MIYKKKGQHKKSKEGRRVIDEEEQHQTVNIETDHNLTVS